MHRETGTAEINGAGIYYEVAGEGEPVEQTAQVLVVGVRSIHQRRPPEAAHVVADDPVALGEGLELALPHPAVRDPRVHQDQRLPFSRNLVVDPCAVDLGHARLPKHLYPLSNTAIVSVNLSPWRRRDTDALALTCIL